jgi:hypothetical protein
MEPVVAVVVLAGSLWGTRRDPAVWVLLVICAILGGTRCHVLFPLVAAAVATAFTVATVWSWWDQLGIEPTVGRIGFMLLLRVIYAYAGYGIGRLIGRASAARHSGI